jgi:hypothetical protein
MPTEPCVAAIMPAYRAEATGPGAVRSLRAQTCASRQASVASHAIDHLTGLERGGVGAQRLPQMSRHYAQSGRCASLEDSLEITENGRAHRAVVEPARLLEEPVRAG